MNSWRRTLIAILLLWGFVCRCEVRAGELEISGTTETASRVAGQSEVSIRFDGLDNLVGQQVLYAKCILALSLDSCELSDFQVVVTPVRALSTATRGNERIGETINQRDLDSTQSSLADVTAGQDGYSEVLLTQLVQQAVKAGSGSLSLTLTPLTDDAACRVILSTSVEKAGSTGGRLIVKYTRQQ